MSAFKTTWLGIGRMPHVGEHPGTRFMLILIAISATAGAKDGGIIGAVGGALVMCLGMGPLYLWGAYDRAKLSHRLSAKKGRS